MQKHAFSGLPLEFNPLPVSDGSPLYFDKTPIDILYYNDFPKLHYHHRYEIGICLKGSGLSLYEGRYFSLSAGDVVFVAPEASHYSRSLSTDELCICRFLYYSPEPILKFLNISSEENEAEFNLFLKSIPPVIKASEYPEANRAFKRLCELCFLNPAQNELLMGLKISGLLLESHRWFKPEKNNKKGNDSQIPPEIKLVAEYISLHYNEEISAKALSKMCHLSESQLRRQFVAAYGMPPIAYKNSLRAEIAAELLTYTELTISEISDKLGYTSTSDFYRMFKGIYGCSPSKYRKQ